MAAALWQLITGSRSLAAALCPANNWQPPYVCPANNLQPPYVCPANNWQPPYVCPANN